MATDEALAPRVVQEHVLDVRLAGADFGLGWVRHQARGSCCADSAATHASLHLSGLARSVEPFQIRLFAEPDQLAPGVPAVLLDDERSRCRLVADAVQQLERLAIDQTAERVRRLRNSAGEQPPDLVHEAPPELLIDAARHALGGQRRGNAQPDGDHATEVERRDRLGEMRRQRTAGEEVHLERAHEADAIPRLNPSAPIPDRLAATMRHRNSTPRRAAMPLRRARRSSSRPGAGNRPRVSAR